MHSLACQTPPTAVGGVWCTRLTNVDENVRYMYIHIRAAVTINVGLAPNYGCLYP